MLARRANLPGFFRRIARRRWHVQRQVKMNRKIQSNRVPLPYMGSLSGQTLQAIERPKLKVELGGDTRSYELVPGI